MSETIERLAAAAELPRTLPSWNTDPQPRRRTPTRDARPFSVAVLIPCFNEEAAIAKVVTDFRTALPQATVYVYDNNSTDRTQLHARAAGAVVRGEGLQGKGHVVRRMFADIDADAFILVDGDDTYDASAAPGMLHLLFDRHLDMVSAARHPDHTDAYRFGHRFGSGKRLCGGGVDAVCGVRQAVVVGGYHARGFGKRGQSRGRNLRPPLCQDRQGVGWRRGIAHRGTRADKGHIIPRHIRDHQRQHPCWISRRRQLAPLHTA